MMICSEVQKVNIQLPRGSQETPKRLPRVSQETPKRLPQIKVINTHTLQEKNYCITNHLCMLTLITGYILLYCHHTGSQKYDLNEA